MIHIYSHDTNEDRTKPPRPRLQTAPGSCSARQNCEETLEAAKKLLEDWVFKKKELAPPIEVRCQALRLRISETLLWHLEFISSGILWQTKIAMAAMAAMAAMTISGRFTW